MTVLVCVAHADDETLGAGGSIARHVVEGDKVYAVYFTTGLRSRGGIDDEALERRDEHARAAADMLGFEWFARHDYPDNAMDTVPLLSIVKCVEKAIDALRPELVYTHHGGDLNIDHNVVWRAVMTATRPLPEQIVREVRLMEVPSSTEFSLTPFEPNLWVPVSVGQMGKKMDALECYEDELREYPHPRSIRAVRECGLHRSIEGGVGPYAEAFNVVRRRL